MSDAGRQSALDALGDALASSGRVRLLMHSIAFGNLKPLAPVPENTLRSDSINALALKLEMEPERLGSLVNDTFAEGALALHGLVEADYSSQVLEDEDFERTIYAMGSSLVSWVHDIHQRGFFAEDARVLGMTSEGNTMAWRGYAAVSAAKVTLESVCRAIALEYAPYGIRANAVQAGVTNTPALRVIPGSAQMLAVGAMRNPMGRLTRPEDVADFVSLMCTDEAAWVNGALLRVDGGENIAS